MMPYDLPLVLNPADVELLHWSLRAVRLRYLDSPKENGGLEVGGV